MRVLDATSWHMQRYGRPWNAHITLRYSALGIADTDTASAQALLNGLHKAMGRWMKHQIVKYGAEGLDWTYAYVYVHENAYTHGLHTHQLTWIDRMLRAEFEEDMRAWLRRRCGSAYQPEALMVTGRPRNGAYQQVALQWTWYRYLMKGLGDAGFTRDPGGAWQPLHEWLQIGKRRLGGPISFPQRVGCSHNIAAAARETGGFRWADTSASVYSGWELLEYAHRQACAQEQAIIDSLLF